MRISVIFFFLFACFTQGYSEKGPLIVPLKTQRALDTIYIGNFDASRSALAPAYLKELRDCLLFDLSNSCAATIKPQTEKAEQELMGKKRFLPLFWRGERCDFVVKVSFNSYLLLPELFEAKVGIKVPLPSFTLSGSLNTDRRMIHEISDKICEQITGVRGIASTKLLYAVKKPKQGGKKREYESEIWEMDYDGHNKRQLTTEKNYCISPQFFPIAGKFTRNRFFYVNYKQGPSKIYSAPFSASQGTPLIPLRGNQLLPSISKEGHLIAFISDAPGKSNIFIQPLNIDQGVVGKPIQVYSYPNSVQASPTFSPDSKQIAFVSDKGGTPRIYVIDTPYPRRRKKHHLRCLTKKYRENTSPCWSPDGTKLAYSAKIKGVRQIMVYDFKTKEEVQLTEGKTHKENPSFAPNSLHLVFQTVDSSSELLIINLKQRKAMQITKGPEIYHYPHWGLARTKMRRQ